MAGLPLIDKLRRLVQEKMAPRDRAPSGHAIWSTPWRDDLPDFAMFRDIQVVPPRAFYAGDRLVDGGPVWPDFKTQTTARFLSGQKPRDRNPARAAHPKPVAGDFIWGGFATGHFGHFVVEHAGRLLSSMRQRPDDRVLFVLGPNRPGLTARPFFWNVTGWFGVTPAQVGFVRRAIRVGTLRVMPQAEHFNSPSPSTTYLDVLDENMARNRLVPSPNRILYVSREGMLDRARGGHAGERHLAARLRAMGVRVLDRARTALRDQLALYAGAETLVFAEGSAMHGRQLLGRIGQRIVVLNRRPGSRIASHALAPRWDALSYAEVTADILLPFSEHRQTLIKSNALSFYDLPALFETFREHGLDLAGDWDDAAYQDAVDRDRQTFHANYPRSSTAGPSRDKV